MIVNNLIENKVDILSDLMSITGPVLSMRDSEYVIPYGGKLVLNYYVCPYYGPEYPNGDGTVTVGKPGADTFTFVVRIDEDTLDLDQVPEYKQTTFQGEQTMEIDCSKLTAGMHSALVQVISGGLSSPCIWLKFRVKEENEEAVIASHTVDLSAFTNGQQFTSQYVDLGGSYIDAGTGLTETKPSNSSKKCVRALEYIKTILEKDVAERVIVAKYTVKVKSQHEVEIVVDEGGRIYHTFVNNWTGYQRKAVTEHSTSLVPGGYDSISEKGSKAWNISGTYTLTDRVTIDGTEHLLKNYLDVNMEDIPTAVRNAAIGNKFALMRLCEAVHAKFSGDSDVSKRCKLVLPQGMDIVFDYHGFNITGEGEGSLQIDFGSVSNQKDQQNWALTRFPDTFTLDLNGSTVSALQASDLNEGTILMIADCYDTHIINGNTRGTFKGKDYNSEDTAEWLCNVMITGSEFCSFENIDDFYSTGYDGECNGRGVKELVWDSRYNNQYAINRVIFNQPGYIDFDGRKHRIDTVRQYDADSGNMVDVPVNDGMLYPRYTEGIDGDAGAGYSDSSLLHKIINSSGSTLYRGRKPIRSGIDLLHGGYIVIGRTRATSPPVDISGDDAFFPGSIYIYFYKEFDPESQVYQDWLADKAAHAGEEGYEPDFEPLEFIKAYKVRSETPILCPKDAKYAHMCAVGTFTVHNFHGLKRKNSSDSIARLHLWEMQASWACGYKHCNFIYGRTSVMNWHRAYQCHMRDGHTYCLGSGRHVIFGGMSNQTYNIDTEDMSFACGQEIIDGLECIAGGSGARLHHPIDICFSGLRSYDIVNIGKNIFIGVLRNSYVNVLNRIGYSHPTKYLRFDNNILTKMSTNFENNRGSSRGNTLVENCVVLKEAPDGDTQIIKKEHIITGELNS